MDTSVEYHSKLCFHAMAFHLTVSKALGYLILFTFEFIEDF
jgi:hypothetical protein